MRAVCVNEYGGPDALEVEQRPIPTPGSGDLLVRVVTAGVNFRDVSVRRGIHAERVPISTPIGCEGAGLVVEIGPDAPGFAVGDRVAWANVDGSYAEFAAIPAAQAVHVPDDVPMDAAASVLSQGLTAHYLATSVWGAAMSTGTAVILAAAGGVGRLLTQIVSSHGGTVIGVVSSETKRPEASAAGAAQVVVGYDGLADAVRAFTGGAGADILFDGVGGDGFTARLPCVRRTGIVVSFGAAGGPVPPIDLTDLATAGSVSVTRPRLADFVADHEEFDARARELFAWLADGRINAQITHLYALEDAAQAHRDLESRQTTGKLVIVTTPGGVRRAG